MIKIYTCVTKEVDYVGLNLIIEEWEKLGYVQRIHIPYEGRFCVWIGRIGGLVLEPSDIMRQAKPYEYALCSQWRSEWKDNNKILPWNFYVRNWADYKKVQDMLPLEKTTKSIFSGTIRQRLHGGAPKQTIVNGKHIRNVWLNSTEIFSYRPARKYTRTNTLFPTLKDYYVGLAKSKFGLCPAGDCGVCQREIETMGVGCIPFYTPGVEYNYFCPPVENEHFIYADNPIEMNQKIDNMKKEDEDRIRKNGIEYFNKYCSPTGLWNSVLETIEKYNIKIE